MKILWTMVCISFFVVTVVESNDPPVDTSLASIVQVMEKYEFINSLEETKKSLKEFDILDARLQDSFVEVWEIHLIDYNNV